MAEQDKFNYSIPETDAPSRWDDLSPKAREAVVVGASDANPADDLLAQAKETSDELLSPEDVAAWAGGELEKAIDGWRNYTENLMDIPESVEHLQETHPNYNATTSRLCHAMVALSESGIIDWRSANITDSMGLVLVPWRNFQGALAQGFWARLEQWRGTQDRHSNTTINPDAMDGRINEIIENNEPLYRYLANPSSLIRPRDYVEYKLEDDGPWGIMLTQKKGHIHPSRNGTSPNALTVDGKDHYRIAGHDVDGLGILEWLSLTLQEHPTNFSRSSWLLANRIDSSKVPFGRWYEEESKIETLIGDADAENAGGLPRLTVL